MSTPSGRRNIAPGTVVAGYRVKRELGRGAMAVVYLAIQENLERPVALKILTENLASNQEFVQRFFNEARAAASFTHPKIIQAYDAGVAPPDIYYFAMEYIEGETLYNRIKRERKLSPSIALTIAVDIADALDYGWKRQKLVHGDIKPENIMCSVRGETKLADFGLAKVTGHDYAGEGIMLTPLYASPEAILGKAQHGDCRPDIYSFGATIYHALAGEPPYPGTDPQEVMKMHLQRPVPVLMERNPKVTRELSDFVGRLLAKAPDDRPASWEEVMHALEWFHSRKIRKVIPSATTYPAGVYTRSPRDGSLWWVVGIILLAIVIVLVAAWPTLKNRARRPLGTPEPGTVIEPTRQPGSTEDAELLRAWQALKRQVAQDADPRSCVQMLEGFRKTWGKRVPKEFFEYHNTYQARVAMLEVEKKTPPEPPAPRPEPVPPPPPPKPPPRQDQGTVTEPAPATPTVKPPDAPRPKPDAADTRVARADAFAELLYDFGKAAAKLPVKLEPLMQKGREWQERFPGASEEGSQVAFLLTKVLPAFEEFIPKVASRKDKWQGKTLPKYPGKAMKEINATELILTEKSGYGQVNLRVKWSDMDRVAAYTVLGKLALADADPATSDYPPYLAMLLLARQAADLQTAADRVPDGADKRQWQLLAAAFARADTEGKALAAIRDAKQAAERGEYGTAWENLQAAKSLQAASLVRHADDMEKINAVCLERVPQAIVAVMMEKAQSLMTREPAAALQLLNVVQARYGRLDFPEKSDLPALREKILTALRADRDGDDEEEQVEAFLPLVEWRPRRFPGASALLLPLIQKKPGMTPELKNGINGLVLLEMGDWDGARKALGPEVVGVISSLPPRMQTAFWFGRGLISDRYADSSISASAAMGRLSDLRGRSAAEGIAAALLGRLVTDYALLTQQYSQRNPPFGSLANLVAVKHGALPNLMTAMAWMCEAGRAAEGITMIEELTAADSSFLTPPEVAAVTAMLNAAAATAPPTLRSGVVPEGQRDRYARLGLSAFLSSAAATSAKTGSSFIENLRPLVTGDGLLAANTWFDVTLMQIGYALQENNLTAAGDILRDAHRVQATAVSPYYPRLCLLAAGRELLAGSSAAARDHLQALTYSTVASKAECQAAGLVEKKKDAAVSPAAMSEAGAAYWQAWLEWAQAQGSGKADTALPATQTMLREARSLAQKRFADILAALSGGGGSARKPGGPARE